MLLETSEEKKTPAEIKQMLELIATSGCFEKLSGIIIGKPQDQAYFLEYKKVYEEFFKQYPNLSVLYNVNIGHAYPKMILELGSEIEIDFDKKTITTLWT
ncbi:hypothetical protein [Metamycoplasma neophronis]|uniref:LD-carboxypeptidase C-terminal domain-containing protein n=1 Tax=Metamycoplasma neophronis TaxID=872983 RepID=A0ABY2YZP3_9BACT|nr:hypothetical protein [Metamycoplasma neophronis]TPR53846.1 hypothetical protein FJR74_01625 [Metamycoplasma neophronis]